MRAGGWIKIALVLGVCTLLSAQMPPGSRMNAQLLEIAEAAFERGEWALAYQAYWRLERNDESVPFIYYYLGRAAYEMGDYDRAKKHFEYVLELSPEHPSASYELARTHLRYARRHENEARELFRQIPEKELPKEARRVVSNFAGFSALPHGHRIDGELEAVGFIDSEAPLLPRLIDDRYGLLDPQPSTREKNSARGSALTLGLTHQYRQVDDCGFRWENRLEGSQINYPGIADSDTNRYHLSTALSFRVDERFWFTPEYFMSGGSFGEGAIEYDRTGWAIRAHGNPLHDHTAWARFAWYKEDYTELNTTQNSGISTEFGIRRQFGIHHLDITAGLELTTKEQDENEEGLGLYTQSVIGLKWVQRFTPMAIGILEGELYHLEWKNSAQSRQDTLAVVGMGLESMVHEDWRFDYGVKLARNEADNAGESYTKSVVRLGVRYLF